MNSSKYLLPIKSLPKASEFNEDSWAWSLATFTSAHSDLFNSFLRTHQAALQLYANAYNLPEYEAFMKCLSDEDPRKKGKPHSQTELGDFLELEVFARSWFFFLFKTFYPDDNYEMCPF